MEIIIYPKIQGMQGFPALNSINMVAVWNSFMQ